MNLSAFLQQVLKAEQCNFLGENQSGTGANQKIYSTHVPLLRGTVNSKLKIFQNATFEAKGQQVTISKAAQCLFSIDPYTYLTICRYR